MYGSWVYATDGWICHSYSGNNVLYPVAQNWSGVYSQVVQGLSYWGSEPACPPDMLPAVAARVRPLARSFAVLRRPARAVPAHIARLIGYAGLTETKARLARAVDTATGGGWVSEGDTGVCLSVPDPVDGFGVTCQGSGQVRDRGLMLMMPVPSDPDAVQVTALLPDGASATIVSDAGRTALGDNDDGLISFTARRGDRIAIQTASGSRSVSVPTATDSTAP
jgi:hypothetical protein